MTGKQNKQLRKLAEQLELKLVLLYGSKAGGSSRPGSDFDVAVLSVNKPDHRLFNQFRDQLLREQQDYLRKLDI